MNSQFFLLYLAVFINILGFGMVIPLLPFYAQSLGANTTQLGLLAASFSIGQFFSAPLFGRVSDRFGRKPILGISLVGTALAFLIFGLADSLSLLFLSRTLQGIFSSGSFPIAAAYIGDITSKEERVKFMGQLTAVFSLGFIVGPAVSGLLSGYNQTLPFFVAAIISFLNSLFIFAMLPESLTQKEEKIVIREGLVNIGAIVHGLKGEFGILFFLAFAWAFAISNFQVAFPLFAESKFAFTGTETGFAFAFVGVISAVTQWFILLKISRKVGEFQTVALGALGMALGQFFIPTSPTVAFLYIFTSLSSLGGSLLRPTINAILSKRAKVGQGTTMGLAFSFESLGRIVGPLLAGVIIGFWGTQSQFILTGAILFVGFLLLLKETRKVVIQKA